MNHDYAHCANYDPNVCPPSCFRGQLTADYKRREDLQDVPVPWEFLKGTDACELNKPKHTRFDIFRTMSVEDLAEFLCESRLTCGSCPAAEFCKDGHIGFIDWLQQEAEEG